MHVQSTGGAVIYKVAIFPNRLGSKWTLALHQHCEFLGLHFFWQGCVCGYNIHLFDTDNCALDSSSPTVNTWRLLEGYTESVRRDCHLVNDSSIFNSNDIFHIKRQELPSSRSQSLPADFAVVLRTDCIPPKRCHHCTGVVIAGENGEDNVIGRIWRQMDFLCDTATKTRNDVIKWRCPLHSLLFLCFPLVTFLTNWWMRYFGVQGNPSLSTLSAKCGSDLHQLPLVGMPMHCAFQNVSLKMWVWTSSIFTCQCL